ncbi:hypothetical protein AFEL58S_02044 [Afipia felis]
MVLPYNSERGEVPLAVGGTDLVIAAEMEKLAALSGRLNCQSFLELYSKLAGVELVATMAAIELLAVKGDTGAALKSFTITDLPACKDAFVAALLHHTSKAGGNGDGARGGTTSKSPGADGSALQPSG